MKKSVKQYAIGFLFGAVAMFFGMGAALSAPVAGNYERDAGMIMQMRGLDSDGKLDTCVHNSKSKIVWAGSNGKPCTYIYE